MGRDIVLKQFKIVGTGMLVFVLLQLFVSGETMSWELFRNTLIVFLIAFPLAVFWEHRRYRNQHKDDFQAH